MSEPKVIETFMPDALVSQFPPDRHTEPSCFNGWVHVRKYRITVEEVPEPDDVIKARILKLWEESKNHHDWGPLRAAAIEYGMELPSRIGRKS